jgi:hypothetical protein
MSQWFNNKNPKFQPLCTADGLYARVQRQRDLEWCVDAQSGRELPGTRTNSGVANCDQPRECRALTCQLECEFGYQVNFNYDSYFGSITDYIWNFRSTKTDANNARVKIHVTKFTVRRTMFAEWYRRNVAQKVEIVRRNLNVSFSLYVIIIRLKVLVMLLTINILTHIIKLIPGLLNVCLRGEPLTKASTRLLVQCNVERKQLCPPGWFCQQIGMGASGGYCCAGIGTFLTFTPNFGF